VLSLLTSRKAAQGRIVGLGPLSIRRRLLSALDLLDEAEAFLISFAQAQGIARNIHQSRWAEVRRSVLRQGHYDHTPEELAYGAKLAWRNHARCIGRLFWDTLELRDRRDISAPEQMFQDVCDHLSEATGDGRIKPIISVYPPLKPNAQSPFIESSQIIQYAGHLGRDGTVTGDRKNVELTRVARAMGWAPDGAAGPFDILPVFIRDARGRRHMFDLPQGSVKEVAIHHPDFPDLQDLGLKWYAVPLVSDFFLTIGGIDYPCAPFNGFYMASEIASRNSIDRHRDDLRAVVAGCFGLDTDAASPLWRDTALTELNRAVLESYKQAGVTLVDHHTASKQFRKFHARENAAGRDVSADWAWIVPPQASAAADVFHLSMQDHKTCLLYKSDARDELKRLESEVRTRVA